MLIPPIVFAYGAQRLCNWLTKGSGGGLFGGPPPIDYSFYAVPHRDLGAFLDDHPDAVAYDTFARQATQAGYGSYAGGITKQGRDMQRKYPDWVVVCADFRRT